MGGGSVDVHTFADDFRRHKNQQLVLVVRLGGGLEQVAEHRHVTQPRHLGGDIARGGLENTAEHHGLTVVHQHLGQNLAGVDGGHVHTTRGHDDGADVIVTHVEVENDAA